MKRLALIALCVLLVGCKNPYGACVNASSVVAQSIATAMQQSFNLEKQGLITPQEESNLLDYFEFANKADGAFLACSTEAHANGNKPGTYTACVTIFNNGLNNPQQLALLHVENSSAAATVSASVTAIIVGVTSLLAALGGS